MIGLLIFMVCLAFILALWEIQIEGKDGWGGEIPWLAHRKGMGDEVNRRTAADRLSCLHDTVS